MHDHSASNNAVGAVKIKPIGLLINLGKARVVSRCLLEIASQDTAVAVLANVVRVKVTAHGGAAHAAITELMDMETVLARFQIGDGSIDDNIATRLLGEIESTTDLVLLLGVLEDALGGDGLVRALLGAGSEQVAIGADSRSRCLIDGLGVNRLLLVRNLGSVELVVTKLTSKAAVETETLSIESILSLSLGGEGGNGENGDERDEFGHI